MIMIINEERVSELYLSIRKIVYDPSTSFILLNEICVCVVFYSECFWWSDINILYTKKKIRDFIAEE
jgi:hypothetical protein